MCVQVGISPQCQVKSGRRSGRPAELFSVPSRCVLDNLVGVANTPRVTYRRTTTLTVMRVVEEFDDTDPPSLSGITIDTTASDAEEPTNPRGICKAQPAEQKRRTA